MEYVRPFIPSKSENLYWNVRPNNNIHSDYLHGKMLIAWKGSIVNFLRQLHKCCKTTKAQRLTPETTRVENGGHEAGGPEHSLHLYVSLEGWGAVYNGLGYVVSDL